MTSKLIAAVGVCLLQSIAHAAPVTVFGITIGAAPAKPMLICSEDYDNRPNLCWHKKPTVNKDKAQLGYVSVPNKDLPEWAAFKMIEMHLTPRGTIDLLTVELEERCDLQAVASSVSTRFGEASENRLGNTGGFRTATWEKPDIFIHLENAGRYCVISFRTPESIAIQRAYNAKQTVKRPTTP